MNGKTTFHTGHQELVQKDLRLYIQDKMKEEQLKVASQRYADLRKKNEDFFATKLQEEGVQEIDGILYKEIKSGKGPRPTDGNMAEVEYQGFLMDSTLFDQTYAPTVFPVSCEVKGLNIALKNMQPGAEWEIYIPWNLGYGSKGRGTSMPPFSTLTYRLKLINFK
jgi:FKBP-type peptidyl-prolyl cis-trans isomerase FklB